MSTSAPTVSSFDHASAASGRSLWHLAWLRLKRNRAAVSAAVILGLIMLAVVFGPLLSPHDYAKPNWDQISAPPSLETGHYFGTDSIGRDLYVRTLYGGRMSLMVGLVATGVALLIGVAWGAIAGFVGGRVDNVMMRIVDILYALPFMFLVILLMVVFGRNILLIFIAIGSYIWLDMARIVRGQTLSLRQKEFVEAAEALGVRSWVIIWRHIVPNLLGIVAVYVTLTVPKVILVESFLSFLGLGVQEPNTSWGALVNDGAQDMEFAPWGLFFPAVFLAATLFCLNFLGDGLRDALDPKDR
ncbi:MAG: ABC transporter permease subunit [Wenzhouxiangella sp.]|jgi:oligopeptide transport system permease protein|nr:ABC transporter permease subunit [Wenzhouxiangella sp.]